MFYNDFIYTQPEIIAHAVGEELRKPKVKESNGLPKEAGKLGFLYALLVFSIPITILGLLLLPVLLMGGIF